MMQPLVLTVLFAIQDPVVAPPAQLVHSLLGADAEASVAAGKQLRQLGRPALPTLAAARARATTAELRSRIDLVIGGIAVDAPGPLTIAFTRGEGATGEVHLWRDGTESQLTTNDGVEAQLTLSPDGKRLAFAIGGKHATASTERKIAVIDLTTGKQTMLGHGVAPVWSASSQAVTFVRGGDLLQAPADGGKERQLVTGLPSDIYHVRQSGDGSKLFVEVNDSILVFDAKNGKELATLSGKPAGASGLYSFSVSADGTRIAMVSGHGPYHWDLFVAGLDGAPDKLTDKPFRHGISAIAPDGKSVLACVSNGDTYTLQLFDVAERKNRIVATSANPLLAPTWSPDGTFAVFVTAQNRIVLLHVASGVTREIAAMQPLYGPAEMWFAPAVRFGN